MRAEQNTGSFIYTLSFSYLHRAIYHHNPCVSTLLNLFPTGSITVCYKLSFVFACVCMHVCTVKVFVIGHPCELGCRVWLGTVTSDRICVSTCVCVHVVCVCVCVYGCETSQKWLAKEIMTVLYKLSLLHYITSTDVRSLDIGIINNIKVIFYFSKSFSIHGFRLCLLVKQRIVFAKSRQRLELHQQLLIGRLQFLRIINI